MTPTTQQIGLLHHTLGLRPDQRNAHRNHFVAGEGHHDMPDLEALEASGLMARGRTPSFIDKTDVVFYVTDAGRELALQELPHPPPPAKRTQHGRWLDADCGESFAEWLCRYGVPRYDLRWDRGGFEYRMHRNPGGIRYAVTGEWAPTKKAAKASYKEALRRSNRKENQ